MYTLSTESTFSYQPLTTSQPKLKLSQELLDSARERILGQGSPVVLAKNISLESYLKFCEAEKNLPVKIRLLNGEIVAYEVASTPHGSAADEVRMSIGYWSRQVNGSPEDDINVAPNSYFTADYSFRPKNLPPPPAGRFCNSSGSPYPNMVLEVGNLEPLSSLHALAPFYLSQRTTIMIYLAIKLYPTRAQQPGRPMVAMLYQRTSQTPNIPTRVISFGSIPLHNRVVNYLANNGVPGANITGVGRHGAPPCNAPNIPIYQLPIPAAEIFHRTPTILPSINFNLDLWEVQNRALYDL